MFDRLIKFVSLVFAGKLIPVVVICAMFVILPACTSGGGGGGNDGNGGGSGGQQSGGGGSSGTPGTGDAGTGDTGSGGTGSGDTGTGGTGTGDTGGGGTGSGGTGTTILGTFSTLYEASNIDLTINTCSTANISGAKTFTPAYFRVFNQTDNAVRAAFTLTPTSVDQFDQVFINLTGDFISLDTFEGTLSVSYSLAGAVIAQSSGTVKILVIGTSIRVELVSSTETIDCSIVGGPFFMSEAADPAGPGTGTGGDTGGGGTGGDTGGTGTGGGSGGGTGGSGDGSMIDAIGQFGILTFASPDFPEENANIEITKVIYTTIAGLESFAWLNTVEGITINVYFGNDPSNATITNQTTYNSPFGRSFYCFCLPAIDLLNSEVIFNNVVLNTRNGETLTVNGVLAIPNLNP